MLDTDFQAAAPSGSEEKNEYLLCIKPRTPGAGHFGPGGHHLNKTVQDY